MKVAHKQLFLKVQRKEGKVEYWSLVIYSHWIKVRRLKAQPQWSLS